LIYLIPLYIIKKTIKHNFEINVIIIDSFVDVMER
jgi:hypothetical protein